MLAVLFLMAIIAGIFNTMAAGGSFLMLPLLIFAGLPATVANGTNRISLFFQNGMAAWGFQRQGVFDFRTNVRLTIPAVAGSVAGALMSVRIPDTVFQKIISILMLVFVAITVYRERRKRNGKTDARPGPVATFFLFVLVGVYGGFIQAGVGLFLIGAIRFTTGLDLVRTNAVKVFIIMCYTLIAIAVFAANGKIDWPVAAVVATGQGIGGYLGSRIAISGGEKLVKRLVLVAIILMAARLLFA